VEPSIRDLLARVRKGDPQAASEIVRRFEPELRREVRLRLTSPDLRRIVDSLDVCQSVLGNFFARMAMGQFEIRQGQDLVRLLAKMARNKVIDYARKEHSLKRDARKVVPLEGDTSRSADLASRDPTPSDVVGQSELLIEVRRRLSHEELRIADGRANGQSWAEIGVRTGESPEGVRKRYSRALDRVSEELGL
jgi:RNA polymerase sigma-70 factor (ECF subfamily)